MGKIQGGDGDFSEARLRVEVEVEVEAKAEWHRERERATKCRETEINQGREMQVQQERGKRHLAREAAAAARRHEFPGNVENSETCR